MVLGMTSPAVFRELFAEAPEVSEETLGAWFDQKTATFGGRDVVATVKEIVGNCDRFDYQAVGRDVPPLDLPDLRPFLEAMLVQNRRRPRRGDDGSLSFKTPEAWLHEVGVRSAYEGLVFDRGVRGKDAIQRVVGVGHKAFDWALRQAQDESAWVASASGTVLRRPIVVARVFDRVTGIPGAVRSVVVAAERSETGEWTALRDWETVRTLNEVVGDVAGLRRFCAPPEDRALVKAALAAAVDAIESSVGKFGIGFRVPSIEVVAVLWPGTESRERIRPGADPDALDEILE
jgi:hypothetical protein